MTAPPNMPSMQMQRPGIQQLNPAAPQAGNPQVQNMIKQKLMQAMAQRSAGVGGGPGMGQGVPAYGGGINMSMLGAGRPYGQ